ncbi:hypothetical protein SAMN02949497_1200 [Methylomagnum ishizawai]|uniref:Uncharacterized protein n=1 Tax=Methylomagnum ishizawai TaxID=1760988 RepID=A0A1Y6D0H3_9GAMM|nr:hypothetical protein [Methylomagnum ishizawai]SMF93904.1 hypothetical protein SAMN02949497_1200 [Methylomagnum ishizawai]
MAGILKSRPGPAHHAAGTYHWLVIIRPNSRQGAVGLVTIPGSGPYGLTSPLYRLGFKDTSNIGRLAVKTYPAFIIASLLAPAYSYGYTGESHANPLLGLVIFIVLVILALLVTLAKGGKSPDTETTQERGSSTIKINTQLRPLNANDVVLVGVDIPFWDMVFLMVKWAIATIPAFFILSMLGYFVFYTLLSVGNRALN